MASKQIAFMSVDGRHPSFHTQRVLALEHLALTRVKFLATRLPQTIMPNQYTKMYAFIFACLYNLREVEVGNNSLLKFKFKF